MQTLLLYLMSPSYPLARTSQGGDVIEAVVTVVVYQVNQRTEPMILFHVKRLIYMENLKMPHLTVGFHCRKSYT